MATSAKALARNAKPGMKSPKAGKKVGTRPVSRDEQRFLEISMGLLDAMPDDRYKETSEKLHRLVKRNRASS